MSSIDFDRLGDTHKMFEKVDAGRAIMPGIPVLARLDGRGFHNFTKGLKRPFDPALSLCMNTTAKFLLDKSCAQIAYTQSDEITLCWLNPETEETKVFFGGKFQKLCSILAATASIKFNNEVLGNLGYDYASKGPIFDCRVWQVPTIQVAAQNFLWREMDARKNSVSMAASTYFSPTELYGKSTKERIAMLETKSIKWEDYPMFFKKGVYLRRAKRTRFLTADELAMIPEAHRPVGPIERTEIAEVALPKATSISNLAEVLFFGAEPKLHTLPETEDVK